MIGRVQNNSIAQSLNHELAAASNSRYDADHRVLCHGGCSFLQGVDVVLTEIDPDEGANVPAVVEQVAFQAIVGMGQLFDSLLHSVASRFKDAGVVSKFTQRRRDDNFCHDF